VHVSSLQGRLVRVPLPPNRLVVARTAALQGSEIVCGRWRFQKVDVLRPSDDLIVVENEGDQRRSRQPGRKRSGSSHRERTEPWRRWCWHVVGGFGHWPWRERQPSVLLEAGEEVELIASRWRIRRCGEQGVRHSLLKPELQTCSGASAPV